jgi:hypothetical protein
VKRKKHGEDVLVNQEVLQHIISHVTMMEYAMRSAAVLKKVQDVKNIVVVIMEQPYAHKDF